MLNQTLALTTQQQNAVWRLLDQLHIRPTDMA